MDLNQDDTLSVISISDSVSISSDLEPTIEAGDQLKDSDTSSSSCSLPTKAAAKSTTEVDQHHPRFFIPDESIILMVDSVLYKVPSFILKAHSPKLRDFLESGDREDTSSLVENITSTDLERFLSVLFPTKYGRYDASTVEEWTSILKVAHNWEFESIRQLALEQIEPLATPVDKVVLGETYRVPNWAEDGRVQLCMRQEPISLAEALRMGIEEVVKMSAARHHVRSPELLPDAEGTTIRSLLSEDMSGSEDSSGGKVSKNLIFFVEGQQAKRRSALEETSRVVAQEQERQLEAKLETQALIEAAQLKELSLRDETEQVEKEEKEKQAALRDETKKLLAEQDRLKAAAKQSENLLQEENKKIASAKQQTKEMQGKIAQMEQHLQSLDTTQEDVPYSKPWPVFGVTPETRAKIEKEKRRAARH